MVVYVNTESGEYFCEYCANTDTDIPLQSMESDYPQFCGECETLLTELDMITREGQLALLKIILESEYNSWRDHGGILHWWTRFDNGYSFEVKPRGFEFWFELLDENDEPVNYGVFDFTDIGFTIDRIFEDDDMIPGSLWFDGS